MSLMPRLYPPEYSTGDHCVASSDRAHTPPSVQPIFRVNIDQDGPTDCPASVSQQTFDVPGSTDYGFFHKALNEHS